MTSVMLNMRVKEKRTMMPFQKGIAMTNNSLKLMYNDLKTEYSISYLLTYKLNQDVLENFFGTIRSKGDFRSCILGRNKGSLSMNGNTLVDNTPDLEGTGYLSSTLLKTLNPDFIATEAPADELESLQYNGLEHLAGYICHRINNPDLALQNTQQGTSFTWTNQLTEGFLQKPKDEMMVNMEKMEAIFKSFKKDDIVLLP